MSDSCIFCFMYLLQIDGGRITLSCHMVNPKSIHEMLNESLMGIFMKHLQPDPVHGGWKFLTSEDESMGKLLLKCKILLSYVMGTNALRIQDRWVVLVRLIQLCSHYLPDTYFLRLKWGVQRQRYINRKWSHRKSQDKKYRMN